MVSRIQKDLPSRGEVVDVGALVLCLIAGWLTFKVNA